MDADADLDIFVDISASGYGAVAYRRVETEDEVDVAFLAGKSHVVPLDKSSHLGSMPRLELSGRVKGIEVKLDLQQSIKKPFREIRIWTDSHCLLKWVWNDTIVHKVYVSNRLAKIHKSSEKEQWKFVDSERNPANLCSRGIKADDKKKWDFYLKGPPFLWLKRKDWPEMKVKDEEMAKISLLTAPAIKEVLKPTEKEMGHL